MEDLTADIHARLVFSPTKEQMNIFYNIYHYENFGVFEFTKFKNSIRNTILDRLRNLWKLYIEKEKFFNGTFWKVLSLKDAGLSLLIRPYGRYMYRKYYIREKENMQ